MFQSSVRLDKLPVKRKQNQNCKSVGANLAPTIFFLLFLKDAFGDVAIKTDHTQLTFQSCKVGVLEVFVVVRLANNLIDVNSEAQREIS